MPWAKLTHERINTVYKDVFDKIVMRERNRELAVREVIIRMDILKRNFSKRQLSILNVIMTFSYFYGKESAWIPKLKDFSLAGVSPTKIKDEIEELVNKDVITWYRGKDFNEFAINDPREWKTPYHSGFDGNRASELFLLNLKHADIPVDIDEIMEKVRVDDDLS